MNNISSNQRIGSSEISSVFGAKVSVTSPQRGMYLVIGNATSPESLVRRLGGDIILRLSVTKLLVTLPFAAYLTLRTNRNIASVGPVTVDMERLTAMAKRLLAATSNGSPV
jgi:hypothetical protein